jgi:hypothetical protein
MTHYTGVAWCKVHIIRKDQTRQDKQFQKDGRSEGTQKWDKEQRPETTAMKQKGIQQDPQTDHSIGVRKASSQIFCQVTKNQGLDIVEGSAPSEMEEPPCNFRVSEAGNVGALATLESFVPTIWKEKRDDGCTPGLTGTISGSRSGRAALRKEQWERLERSHHRKNRVMRTRNQAQPLKEEKVVCL